MNALFIDGSAIRKRMAQLLGPPPVCRGGVPRLVRLPLSLLERCRLCVLFVARGGGDVVEAPRRVLKATARPWRGLIGARVGAGRRRLCPRRAPASAIAAPGPSCSSRQTAGRSFRWRAARGCSPQLSHTSTSDHYTLSQNRSESSRFPARPRAFDAPRQALARTCGAAARWGRPWRAVSKPQRLVEFSCDLASPGWRACVRVQALYKKHARPRRNSNGPPAEGEAPGAVCGVRGRRLCRAGGRREAVLHGGQGLGPNSRGRRRVDARDQRGAATRRCCSRWARTPRARASCFKFATHRAHFSRATAGPSMASSKPSGGIFSARTRAWQFARAGAVARSRRRHGGRPRCRRFVFYESFGNWLLRRFIVYAPQARRVPPERST